MAFDGFTVACLTQELKDYIEEGRITKISQPEKDQLLLTIKKGSIQKRLFISVNPSLPLIYLTENNITSPLQAPSFCMLLRKYISNGKILSVSQPEMERIIELNIEHYNEMGDLCTKILTIELMGKHSNIIFRDNTKIIDSIKHVNSFVSSVREVLPGRDYFIPFFGNKMNPVKSPFLITDSQSCMPISSYLVSSYTGISPILAEEILYNSGVDSQLPVSALSNSDINRISDSYNQIVLHITEKKYNPNIVYEKNEPIFFGPFSFELYNGYKTDYFNSISELLFEFYSKKQDYTITRQKTAELRQVLQSILNKDNKKYDLQLKQIKDTEKKDRYKLFGELITAYGYNVPSNSTFMTVNNYYDDTEITIPLDPTVSAIENGKKYFEKYTKLKRTYSALSEIVQKTKEEITHLEGLLSCLEMVRNEADISEIKKEMQDYGYIHKSTSTNKKNGKIKDVKSIPLFFISSDGYDILVGKNNYQNEHITFKVAEGNDWWFHAKNISGSHVIVKARGKDVPDSTIEEAARLAAHFSSAKDASKIEVDYTPQKYIKKPAGSAPGFVIYHKYYSIIVSTKIDNITEIIK